MLKKGFFAILIMTTVTGCAGMGGSHSIPEADFKFEPKAFQDLAEASVEARDELRLLAKTRDSEVQASMTPSQKKQRFEQAVNVPKGFEKVTTVQFTGEAKDAVQLIAKLAGYEKVIEVGKKPRSAMIVSIDQRDVQLINALNELGMQTGDKATIEVFPSTKMIRIKYTDIDQKSSDVYSG